MGVEILGVLEAVQLGSKFIGGLQEAEGKRKEARSIRAEARIEEEDAIKAADISRERGEQFLAEQSLGITASGLKIKGSSLEMLEETQTGTEEEFTSRISRAGKVRALREAQSKRTEAGTGPLDIATGLFT